MKADLLDSPEADAEYPVTRPLTGEVALVTGSGRGLGHMIARKLMSLGADIVLHDISEEASARFGEAESLSALAESLCTESTTAMAVTGDITSSADIEAMVDKAQNQLGPVSLLVNCAGGDVGADGSKPHPASPVNFKLEDLLAVINRNLVGTMLMCREIAPRMVASRRGAIINIGSTLAHYGSPEEISYSCAKAAIIHYTRCLASELRESGVRVNAVSPGPTLTARFKATHQVDPALMEDGPSLVRYAKPEEIADAISYFAHPHSRYVSGQVLLIDGGEHLFSV